MRQFDVFANPSPTSRSYAPLIVLLQSHHLLMIDTVVVAPLISDAIKPLGVLDVTVTISGQPYVAAISELANMPRNLLGRPVGDLATEEDAIRRALERLFTGF